MIGVQFCSVDENDYDMLYFDPMYSLKMNQERLLQPENPMYINAENISQYDIVYLMRNSANPHEILFCTFPSNSKDNKQVYFRFEYNTIDRNTFVDILESRPEDYRYEEAIYPNPVNAEDGKIIFTYHPGKFPCIRLYSKKIGGFVYGWNGPTVLSIS